MNPSQPVQTYVRDLSAQNLTTSFTKIADLDAANISMLQAFSSAAGEITLGYGVSGSEVAIPYTIGRTGLQSGDPIPMILNKGMDLYAKSNSGTLNTGVLILNFFGGN